MAKRKLRSKPRKKFFPRASRARVERLTLMQINRALVDCGGTKTYAARALGISPRTLMRLRKELLAQQAAEQRAAAPPPPPPPPSAPAAPEAERNPVTGEPLGLHTTTPGDTEVDLGPDSDEEPEPSAGDLPPGSGGCNDEV